MVDTAAVGHLPDPRHLAAVGLGANVTSVLYFMLRFLRMGTTALAAQALGGRDTLELRAVLVRGLLVAAALGLVLVALRPLTVAFAGLVMAPEPGTRDGLATYLTIRMLGAPAALGGFVLLGWLLGLQDARRPLVLMLAIHGRLPPRKGFRRVRRSGLGCRHPSGLDGHRPPASTSSADRLPVMNAGCSALGKRRVPPILVRPFTPSSTLAPAARGSLSGEARPARACASGERASRNLVHAAAR